MKVTCVPGSVPLLVVFPHSGTSLPRSLQARMTGQGRALPDPAWSLPRLLGFLPETGASLVQAGFSRYLIDVDCRAEPALLDVGPVDSPLCPTRHADGSPVYLSGEEPDAFEVGQRTADYWRYFHDDLQEECQRILHRHGVVVLLDVPSTVSPKPEDQANVDLWFRTRVDDHCANSLCDAVESAMQAFPSCSVRVDRAAPVGEIVRQYGHVRRNCHALQLMIDCYLDATTLTWQDRAADHLQPVLRSLVHTLTDWAGQHGPDSSHRS
jgi:N-formylglutamate deformylase